MKNSLPERIKTTWSSTNYGEKVFPRQIIELKTFGMMSRCPIQYTMLI